MTIAEFTTVLDAITAAAFDLACAMPEAAAALHEVASLATNAQGRIEAELDDMYVDELARRHEAMLDAQADAVSAGWGWD